MTRVLVYGGHGKVAMLLSPLLVQRGDDVTAVIRNPEHVEEVEATGATALVLDVEQVDTEALAAVTAGHDAVVWSAGAGGGSPERTYAVDRDAAIRSMDAATEAGAQRYVMVSWIGSRADHGVDPDNSFFAYADAKYVADEYLERSSLDWTVLGPGTLTLGDATERIETEPSGSGDVSRADVAHVVAEVLRQPSTIRRTIRFGGGSTPIADAVK